MMTDTKPYRPFFWKFGLFMPLQTALLAALLTLMRYVDVSAVAIILSVALLFWLIGIPAALLIAWLATRFKWKKNQKDIVLTAITGFIVTLIYEFFIMWITDLMTHQVGSFLHIEVLYLAWIAAVVSYTLATLWLPQDNFQAA